MEIYSNFLNKTFELDRDQQQLIVMIANLGYVTKKQIQLLWSSLKGRPTEFPNTVLSAWTKKGGLLVGRYKNIAHTNRAFYYYPSKLFWRAAEEQDLPVFYGQSGQNIKFNSHNLAAIDVVVQGIYTSVLKAPLWYLKSENTLENENQVQSCINKAVDLIHTASLQRWTSGLNREYVDFVPDELIDLGNNIICIELDNKTEGNQVQLDKLNNYMKYANYHPDMIIQVIFVLNDYSNPLFLNKYIPPYRKLSNQIHAFLTGASKYLGELKRYITEGMVSLSNLEVYVCGTDEADIAVAEAIHNISFGRPNWNEKECLEVADIINKMKFNAEYINRQELQETALGRCILSKFTKYENRRTSRLGKGNCYLTGVMKVKSEEYDNDDNSYYMPIIAGLEHSLYTQLAIREVESKEYINLLYDLQIKANKGDWSLFGVEDPQITINRYQEESRAHILSGPIVIYPRRERTLIPVLDIEVNQINSKSNNFTSNGVSRYSPRYTLADNPLIENELKFLKSALGLKEKAFFSNKNNINEYRQGINQTNFILNSIDPTLESPRQFEYFVPLATKLEAKVLSEKLRLTEIPLQIYKNGFFARNDQAHATPFIFKSKTDKNWQMPDEFFMSEKYLYNAASTSKNRFIRYKINR